MFLRFFVSYLFAIICLSMPTSLWAAKGAQDSEELGSHPSKAIILHPDHPVQQEEVDSGPVKLIVHWDLMPPRAENIFLYNRFFNRVTTPNFFGLYDKERSLNVYVFGVYHDIPFGVFPFVIQSFIHSLAETNGSIFITEMLGDFDNEGFERLELLSDPYFRLDAEKCVESERSYWEKECPKFPQLSVTEPQATSKLLEEGWTNSLSPQARDFLIRQYPQLDHNQLDPLHFYQWLMSSLYDSSASPEEGVSLDSYIEQLFEVKNREIRELETVEFLGMPELFPSKERRLEQIKQHDTLGCLVEPILEYIDKGILQLIEAKREWRSKDESLHNRSDYPIDSDDVTAYFNGELDLCEPDDYELYFRNNYWLSNTILHLLAERKENLHDQPPVLIVYGCAHHPGVLTAILKEGYGVWNLTHGGYFQPRY